VTTQIGAIFAESQALFWHSFIVFLRIGAVMMVLPAFGEQTVPMRVKLAVSFAFTALVAAALPVQHFDAANSLDSFLIYFLTEPVIGLALGLGFRLFVTAMQTAGVIAAQALSLSQILGGAGVEPMPAFGQVLVIAGLALAVMSGLHVQAARAMIMTYDVMPAGQFPQPRDVSVWGIGQIARSFSLAFSLAAPFVLVSLMYNLTLGVINRAMPQLMVAFVGAPVITLGGLLLLVILAPVMLSVWIEAFTSFSNAPFNAAQ
jgi:flagellar biosynthesis protein FliR